MNETVRNSPYSFLHEDGSVWFDLSDIMKEHIIFLIRIKHGGNDGIHKLNKHEQTDIQEV